MNKPFSDAAVAVAIATAFATNVFATWMMGLYCDLTLGLDGFEKTACDATLARTLQPLLPALAVIGAAVVGRRFGKPLVFYSASIAAAGFGVVLALLLIVADNS
jgi:hypothetical protein